MKTETSSSSNERCNHEGDWIARQFFSPIDLQMSPEEYAARNAHHLGCFSFHCYRYQDTSLGAWVRRLGEILFDPNELERCRERFLTPEEMAEVRKNEAEDL